MHVDEYAHVRGVHSARAPAKSSCMWKVYKKGIQTTSYWTDFGGSLNVTYKTQPLLGAQANKNLSATPLTHNMLCIEKQRDSTDQSDHQLLIKVTMNSIVSGKPAGCV